MRFLKKAAHVVAAAMIVNFLAGVVWTLVYCVAIGCGADQEVVNPATLFGAMVSASLMSYPAIRMVVEDFEEEID